MVWFTFTLHFVKRTKPSEQHHTDVVDCGGNAAINTKEEEDEQKKRKKKAHLLDRTEKQKSVPQEKEKHLF